VETHAASGALFVSALLAHEFGHILVGLEPPEFRVTHVVSRAPFEVAPSWVWYSVAGRFAVVFWWLANYLAARSWAIESVSLFAGRTLRTRRSCSDRAGSTSVSNADCDRYGHV
jgi:hypothetical protein